MTGELFVDALALAAFEVAHANEQFGGAHAHDVPVLQAQRRVCLHIDAVEYNKGNRKCRVIT